MEISLGWSGETAANVWTKVNVTVDEGDLRRILIANGLPEADLYTIPTGVVYQLLDNEAERLLLAKLATRHGYPLDQARARLAELSAARTAALAKLQEHFST